MNQSLHNAGEQARTEFRKGLLLLGLLSIFWGLAWPAIKISLNEMHPWTFRTFCLVLGGVGVLGLAKANGIKLSFPSNELKPLLILSLLNITGWNMFTAYGVMRMNASRAVIIAFTMPIWATIFSRFILNERITIVRLCALGLAITGLALLIRPEIEAVGATPLGAVFMLGAAISWALGTALIKYFRLTMPTTVLTGWQLLLGSVPVVVGTLALEPIGDVLKVSVSSVLALSYIIALPMIFCYWAYFKLVRIFPASVAAISTLAIPIIGVFSSALILNETVGLDEIGALFCVVSAQGLVLFVDLHFPKTY